MPLTATLTERLARNCDTFCGFLKRRHRLAIEYILIAVAIAGIGCSIGLAAKLGDMAVQVSQTEAKLEESRSTVSRLSSMLCHGGLPEQLPSEAGLLRTTEEGQ